MRTKRPRQTWGGAGRGWSDYLVAEQLALSILASQGGQPNAQQAQPAECERGRLGESLYRDIVDTDIVKTVRDLQELNIHRRSGGYKVISVRLPAKPISHGWSCEHL